MDKESQHINQLKKGGILSFEYLYNCWSGKLYNFVMRISRGDGYLAGEIVQYVFIKVWENHESLDPDKSFGAYLCTIAKNQLVNIYQHRMQEYLYQEKTISSEQSENTTEKEVDYHLLEEYINPLIEQLPPARKEIFVLSRRSLLTNKEIAEKLHVSENTVESQITKAISFLRSKINQHYSLSIPLLLYWLFD
ncbi:MAG: RNA polymerase sigma-70 factor [Parabacteroides sp.]|nr:RNA polymerase sigma-70 factor [Parabacteroides sp.]